MAYFPMFVELSGRDVLVVGGGSVALRKCERLAPFGAKLSAVAAQFLPRFIELEGVRLLFRPFADADIEGRDMVIAATDSPELNAHIAALCRERSIPVNVVDDAAAGSFIFPAYVLRGQLSAGFCTSGASPTAAAYYRDSFAESLPDATEEILDFMAAVRPLIMERVSEPQRRRRIFAQLFAACLEAGEAPDIEELREQLGAVE